MKTKWNNFTLAYIIIICIAMAVPVGVAYFPWLFGIVP